jgi:L-ascorbate metabolism protein UlaG (beta-lactamase superfamily)
MILCPECSYTNFEGSLYCDDCGLPLLGDGIQRVEYVPGSTRQLKSEPQAKTSDLPIWGATTLLRKDTTLILHFKDSGNRVNLPVQSEIVLGRADERTQTYPDVDLTPMGALEHGVSRNHAAIRRDEDNVILVDFDSANGTFLNGRRLPPHQAHILKDGDELGFGKLAAKLYFKN